MFAFILKDLKRSQMHLRSKVWITLHLPGWRILGVTALLIRSIFHGCLTPCKSAESERNTNVSASMISMVSPRHHTSPDRPGLGHDQRAAIFFSRDFFFFLCFFSFFFSIHFSRFFFPFFLVIFPVFFCNFSRWFCPFFFPRFFGIFFPFFLSFFSPFYLFFFTVFFPLCFPVFFHHFIYFSVSGVWLF